MNTIHTQRKKREKKSNQPLLYYYRYGYMENNIRWDFDGKLINKEKENKFLGRKKYEMK